jgi:hypothetical protein
MYYFQDMPSEKPIENSILDFLSSVGIFAWKNQSVGVYDKSRKVYRKSNNVHHINGVSDILGILPDGRFLAIEVKHPSRKNTATDNQRLFIDLIEKNKGVAFIAWDLDMVIERLKMEQILP